MKLGIAGRLAVLLAGFAIIVGAGTGFMVYRASRDLLSEAAQARLLTTTQVLGRRIVTIVESAQRDAQRMVDHNETRAILGKKDRRPIKSEISDVSDLTTQFSALLRVSPEYYQIRLISAAENGREQVRVDRDIDGKLTPVEGDDLQEKGHYAYVYEALKQAPGGVYVSPVSINHEVGAHAGTGVPSLRIAAPVHDAAGTALGVIVINMSVGGIFKVLTEDLPRDHAIYVADPRGEFLVHPDPKQAFAFDRGQSARIQNQFPATEALISKTKSSVLTTVESRDGTTRPVAAAFIRVEREDAEKGRFFIVGLAQPMSEVLLSSTRLTQAIIPVVLGFAAAALLLAAWLSRAFTRPLRQMARAVRQVPSAHLSADLPIERQDEIGALARGLVAMEGEIVHKIEELNAQQSELAHQARHDTLTGLPNRLLFNDRIEQAMARARRTQKPLALLFIDLDGFKKINDTWGHAAGDAVLLAVAARLRAGLRQMDTVARIGGDEFVLLVEGTDEDSFLRPIASKLIHEITAPIRWKAEDLHVGASIGVSCFPRDGDTADALTSSADSGMYIAKAAGGSGVVFSSSNA